MPLIFSLIILRVPVQLAVVVDALLLRELRHVRLNRALELRAREEKCGFRRELQRALRAGRPCERPAPEKVLQPRARTRSQARRRGGEDTSKKDKDYIQIQTFHERLICPGLVVSQK